MGPLGPIVPRQRAGLTELHPTGLSLPTLKQIDTTSQLGAICKLTEAALNALIQVINKDSEQDKPQYLPLGNTTHDQLPARFYSKRARHHTDCNCH